MGDGCTVNPDLCPRDENGNPDCTGGCDKFANMPTGTTCERTAGVTFETLSLAPGFCCYVCEREGHRNAGGVQSLQ